MIGRKMRMAVSALALSAGIGMVAGDVLATEGYFQHAYGLRHKALAGAGVASIEDATGISLNPAGLVGLGDQFNMGLSLFMPTRWYEASGTLFVNPGKHKSDKDVFPVPTMAYVRQIDADSAFAVSVFGNGGMNTTYRATASTAAFCVAPPPFGPGGGFGPFCGSGKTGVDLMQMFVSAAYARKLGNGFSIGIAPVFAMQRFKAYGLEAYAGQTASGTTNNLTGQGYDYSFGGGVRVGVQMQFTDRLSFGASYQSKMWMSKFDKYRELFAQGGNFDIPANLQVGLAFQATPELKLMLDYRRIFYSDVKSIANSMVSPGVLGASDGPGFGWRDTNTIKVGLEYQATENLILRAGYSYMWPQVMEKTSTMFNILAPGVIRHQFTGGATFRVNEKNDIDLAFMIAPTSKQTGIEYTPLGPTAGSDIAIKMYQVEVSVGWTYNFDGSSRAR